MAWTIQDIVLTTQAQSVSNKAISSSTIATSTPFVDSTTSSKQLAVDLSGAAASTTTTLAFVQTANRKSQFPMQLVPWVY